MIWYKRVELRVSISTLSMLRSSRFRSLQVQEDLRNLPRIDTNVVLSVETEVVCLNQVNPRPKIGDLERTFAVAFGR